MADELTPSAVSREVLHSYREYLLEPGTIAIDVPEPPLQARVHEIVEREGYCRLVVDPKINDGLDEQFRILGFSVGEYDPLLRRVIWLREG